MAIAYKSVGTSTATGTTSAIVTYPAGISAGDIIVLGVVNKYPPNVPGTLTGYTAITNGQGTGGAAAAGTDAGTVTVSTFYKVAVGSESGAATISVPIGNSSGANVTVYSKTSAQYDWVTPVAGWGADSTRGTSWAIVSGSTMDIKVGDIAAVISGANADAQTYSAEVFSCGGLTIGTNNERLDVAITGGNDCRLVMSTHTITAGTASTAGTFTMTANGTLSAGASVIVRLREQWARGTVSPGEGFQAQTGDLASGTFTGAPGGWAGTVTPGDGFQAQLGDAAIVYGAYLVTVAEGAQAQTGDTAIVRAGYVVSSAEGFQAQTGDVASVSFTAAAINVTPEAGFQAQTGDVAGVSVGYVLSPAEGAQAQASDAATVRAAYPVSPQEGNQAQSGDNSVVYANYPLAPAQGFQTQTGDTATMSGTGGGSYTVTPAEGNQSQLGEIPEVRAAYPVSPIDGFQEQAGDDAVVFAGYFVVADDGYQTQTGDIFTLSPYLGTIPQGGHYQVGIIPGDGFVKRASIGVDQFARVSASDTFNKKGNTNAANWRRKA